MSTITLQEAQANLAERVHRLAPGEDVTITENDRPVARLVAPSPPLRARRSSRACRRPGIARDCSWSPMTSRSRWRRCGSTWNQPPARYLCAPVVPVQRLLIERVGAGRDRGNRRRPMGLARGAQFNKAGGSLSISPPLGLTPPGYELPPLRGRQTSRRGDSVAFAQRNSSGTRHETGTRNPNFSSPRDHSPIARAQQNR